MRQYLDTRLRQVLQLPAGWSKSGQTFDVLGLQNVSKVTLVSSARKPVETRAVQKLLIFCLKSAILALVSQLGKHAASNSEVTTK